MSATAFMNHATKNGVEDAAWLAGVLGVCPAQVQLFRNQAALAGLK